MNFIDLSGMSTIDWLCLPFVLIFLVGFLYLLARYGEPRR